MFLKNVANQIVQLGSLIKTTDGSRLTSGATVRWCKDGTWAAGGGTLSVEETDQYKYAPTQAETNCDLWAVAVDHTDAVQPVVLSGRTMLGQVGNTIQFAGSAVQQSGGYLYVLSPNQIYIKHDGNDTTSATSLQAAMVAATAGKQLMIDAGKTYAGADDTSFSLAAGVGISSFGCGRAIVDASATGSTTGLVLNTGCRAERIYAKHTGNGGQAFVLGTNATDGVINDCEAHGSAVSSSDGIAGVIGNHRWTITNNYVHSGYDGVNITGANDLRIENNIFESNGAATSSEIFGIRCPTSTGIIRHNIMRMSDGTNNFGITCIALGSGVIAGNLNQMTLTAGTGVLSGIKTSGKVVAENNTSTFSNGGSGASYDLNAPSGSIIYVNSSAASTSGTVTPAAPTAAQNAAALLASTLGLGGSVDHALQAALAQGTGKWVLDAGSRNLTLYAPDGTTPVSVLTVGPSLASPLTRTPQS